MTAEKRYRAKPFCAVCDADLPDGMTVAFCVPCSKRGHSYRLVADEKDRLWRITHWMRFYSRQGYSDEEIRAIPWFMNLVNCTMSKLRKERGT